MPVSRRGALSIGLRAGAIVAGSALLPASGAFAQHRQTPSAAIGPFYTVVRRREEDGDLSLLKGRRARGELIEVLGRVIDIRGRPVPGARIEVWQANAAGRYAHPADTSSAALDPDFQGFGWILADRLGRYRIRSVKPGPYADGDESPRPPHLHLQVSGRQSRLVTQMLFPDEPLNLTDNVIPGPQRGRLIAHDLGKSLDGARRFGWDIILSGR